MLQLLSLCVLAFATIVNGNYFIVTPNVFRPGTNHRVEVSYVGGGLVNVVAVLGVSGESPLVRSPSTVLYNGNGNIDLTIPDLVPDGLYVLTVTGRINGIGVFENSTSIKLQNINSLMFIQLDKPMYKPNDIVNIRVLCVDQDLKPRKNLVTTISVYDNNDNKLQEWSSKQTDVSGVIEVKYELSDIPPLGTWRIQAKNTVADGRKTFEVDKYVLPKYEVEVTANPAFIVQGETQAITFTIKAVYTYGEHVSGTAKFEFAGALKGSTVRIVKLSKGEVTHETFTVADLNTFNQNSDIKLTVRVTEEPAMVDEESNELVIPVYSNKYKMDVLPDTDSIYKPGLPISIQLRIYSVLDNKPAYVGDMVEISSYNFGREQYKKDVAVNSQGLVITDIEVPSTVNKETSISLHFNLKYQGKTVLSKYHTLKPYLTQLGKTLFVEVKSPQPVEANGEYDILIRSTGRPQQVAYMVLSRGLVVDSGRIDSMAGSSSATMTLTATQTMAPSATIIVYGIVTDGEVYEVIAASTAIQVTGFFSNSVKLGFSSDELRSGSSVDVTVTSTAFSYYFILAVDKSVTLLGTGHDITQMDVKKRMTDFSLEETPEFKKVDNHGRGGSMQDNGVNDVPNNAGQLFLKRGLKYLSGLLIMDRVVPDHPIIMFDRAMDDGNVVMESNVNSGDTTGGTIEYAEVGRVRKNFPEAWMWLDGQCDMNGKAVLKQTVPDTITTWLATAFSISDQEGLAITSESATLKSFQPFFVRISKPYAIKRGEDFILRITVFNYLERDTAVKLTLKKSNDFYVNKKNENGVELKVKEEIVTEIIAVKGGGTGVTYNITAINLGNILLELTAQPEPSSNEKGDALEERILVKPEGIVIVQVESDSVELNKGDPAYTNTLMLNFPPDSDIVPDSRIIRVKVTGDVMGPSIDGLDKLLQMPFGCGEQNMISMVPNIVVYNYLKAVSRLTNKIEDKALRNIKFGYERELQYVRTSGSFSAFGQSDEHGSSWLTAFVMKCFSQASAHITIDVNIMRKASKWLMQKQNADGTFQLIGDIHHQEMMGGTSVGNPLTAFIYIALQESKSFLSTMEMTALTKAQTYLEKVARNGKLKTTYDKAIVAYALSLVQSPLAKDLLEQIDAKNDDKPLGMTGSTKDDTPPPSENKPVAGIMMSYYPPKPTSGDIETWSYVLLAYSKREDIAGGQPIMKWLLKQQNGNGGFRSTQDTVLGLQALADYAAQVYKTPATDIDLKLQAINAEGVEVDDYTFKIENKNTLVLQQYAVPANTQSVKLTATGYGLVIAKVAYQYNTMKEQSSGDDDKEITVTNKVTKNPQRKVITIQSCFRATTDMGMMMVEMEVPTGHTVINQVELEATKGVARVDVIENVVSMYFRKAMVEAQCADVQIQPIFEVSNVKAASIKTYPYYQPETEKQVLYYIEDAKIVDTSSATKWHVDRVVLTSCICLLLSIIMAV